MDIKKYIKKLFNIKSKEYVLYKNMDESKTKYIRNELIVDNNGICFAEYGYYKIKLTSLNDPHFLNKDGIYMHDIDKDEYIKMLS